MMKITTKKTGLTFIKWVTFSLLLVFAMACSDNENGIPENDMPEVEIEDYVPETEDQLTILSDLPAYIYPHNYQGFGAALVNRLNNKVSNINEEMIDSLVTIVVHSSKIQTMGDDFLLLVKQMMMGNNIVIIEPTHEAFSYFCNEVTSTLKEQNENNDNHDLFMEIDMVPGLRQTIEGFHTMSKDESKKESMFLSKSDSQGIFAEAIAVRGSHIHIVDRMVDVAETKVSYERVDTTTNTIVPDLNPQIDKFEGGLQKAPINAYSYGLFADVFTQWLNKQENYIDEMNEIRNRGVQTFNSRSETTKLNLEDICTVQKVEYTVNAPTPQDVSNPLPILVSFEICSVYMEDQKSDYYCVYKKVISYNQLLNCGPEGKREWRHKEGFGYYKAGTFWVNYPYYGPFMRNIYSQSICHTHDGKFIDYTEGTIDIPESENIDRVENSSIEKYSPMNSIGSSDVTHGFSYGFDGGLYLSKDPALNLGFSISWDSSTTRTVSDLVIEASSYEGIGKWNYVGQNMPNAYFNAVKTNSHSFAPEIMRSECLVDHSWIWKVPNSSGSYRLFDETTVTTTIMYHTVGFLKCHTHYVNLDTKKRVSFLMSTPPRYEQKWTMHVKPSINEDIIRKLHEKYWSASGKEVRLPDSSKESRVSISEFINNFKQEMEKKRSSWEIEELYGTYTFSYINYDNNEKIEFTFDVEKPSDNE